MKLAQASLVILGVACGCGGSGGPTGDGGRASVTLEDKTFDVSHVRFRFETGERGYFRVEGDDAAHEKDDCTPGLAGGLALYGDWPADVTTLADLNGRELPFEFTGDGDDANVCFVGSHGLLGVDEGTVRFGPVTGTKVTFAFSGRFTRYDGEGGQDDAPVAASGGGVAHAVVY
jgi:hypothetical protein